MTLLLRNSICVIVLLSAASVFAQDSSERRMREGNFTVLNAEPPVATDGPFYKLYSSVQMPKIRNSFAPFIDVTTNGASGGLRISF